MTHCIPCGRKREKTEDSPAGHRERMNGGWGGEQQTKPTNERGEGGEQQTKPTNELDLPLGIPDQTAIAPQQGDRRPPARDLPHIQCPLNRARVERSHETVLGGYSWDRGRGQLSGGQMLFHGTFDPPEPLVEIQTEPRDRSTSAETPRQATEREERSTRCLHAVELAGRECRRCTWRRDLDSGGSPRCGHHILSM